MDGETGIFTYTMRAFADSPTEQTLIFHIALDDDDDPAGPAALFSSDLMGRRGPQPPVVGSGDVAVNLFDGASNTGFLQISDAFDDMPNMLAVVQQIAWTFAVAFLKGHWARFVDPDRARSEIHLAVADVARREFGDRFTPTPPEGT